MANPTPSNASFGVMLSILTASGTIYAFWKTNIILALLLSLLTTVFAGMTIYFPNKFAKPKRGWLRLGERLGAIVSPVILAILYFIVLVPVGIITRSFGRDTLRLKHRSCSTYWIKRRPSERTTSDFFKQQY